MIFENNADRIATFFLTIVLMPPFIFLSYRALRKSKELSRSSMMRVRVSAFALLVMCIIFLLWGFANLIVAISS